jgi:HK97 family phage prohead protease
MTATDSDMAIVGLVAPYEVFTEPQPGSRNPGQKRRIKFSTGAFAELSGQECSVVVNHDKSRTVVGTAFLGDTPKGLCARIVMHDTPAGQAAWRRVVSGELAGLSVNSEGKCDFVIRDGEERQVYRSLDSLREISLVDRGAFPQSRIWAIGRDADDLGFAYERAIGRPLPATWPDDMGRAYERATGRSLQATWRDGERRDVVRSNPNHVPSGPKGGQFAPGHGGGGSGKPRKKRTPQQRRKARQARLKKFHKATKKEFKSFVKEQKGDRKDLIKGQRKEHADLKREHAAARRDQVKDERKERAELAKEHGKAAKEQRSEHRHEARRNGRARDRHVKHIEAEHIEAAGKVTDHHIAMADKLEQARKAGKARPDLEKRLIEQTTAKLTRLEERKRARIKDAHEHHDEIRKETSNRHGDERKELAESHEYDRDQLRDQHRETRGDIRVEHKEEHANLKETHQEERAQTRADHRRYRQDFVKDKMWDLAAEGFKGKGGRILDDDDSWSRKGEARWKRYDELAGESEKPRKGGGSPARSLRSRAAAALRWVDDQRAAQDERIGELEDALFEGLGAITERRRAGEIDFPTFWLERAVVIDRHEAAMAEIAR